jgi:Raf kinase inhibitor-like YbhB/YbcL family protein
MVKLNLGSLSIESTSFEAEGAIPVGFSADGGNRSPGLRWSSVPDGTVELALVMHDPDAPMTDGFTHWVVTGIDPGATGIEEGEPGTGSSVTGPNEVDDEAYMGPAPPPGHGPHHYFFHLFALDTSLGGQPLSRAEVLERIDGHIIEQARVVGTFQR